MITLNDRRCDSCKQPILEGEPFFHCRTEIVAGKDETLPDLKNPDRIIAQALAELQDSEEQELLDEVYQEIILLLCPDCRVKFLQLIGTMVGSSGCSGCQSCTTADKPKKPGKILQFPGTDKDK